MAGDVRGDSQARMGGRIGQGARRGAPAFGVSRALADLLGTSDHPPYVLIKAEEGAARVLAGASRAPGGEAVADSLPVCRPLDEGSRLHAAVSEQLDTPFTHTWLLIAEMARHHIAGSGDGIAYRDQLSRPWLFRVDSEFVPARGLRLAGARGAVADLPGVVYTCLDTDRQALARRAVEALATHEFGHLLMALLMPAESPDRLGRATRMHLTTAVTDRVLAFYEGWGEHLQVLAARRSRSPHLGRQSDFKANPHAHWSSAVEDALRRQGIPSNAFIHEALWPQDLLGRPADERYRYDLTNAAYAPELLKNPQRMLACEGVAASVFYRLAMDPEIQGHYRESAFYRGFLPRQAAGGLWADGGHFDPRAHIGRYVNATLKLLAAMGHLGLRGGRNRSRAPLVDLVETCGRLYPDERPAFYRSFLETTALVTASPDAGRCWRELATAGRYGHVPELVRGAKEWLELFARTLERCLEQDSLAPLAGPELWLRSEGLKVGYGLWVEPDRPLTVELNAANLIDLLNLGSLTESEARAILARREARGPFASLEELDSVPGLPAASRERVTACAAQDHPDRS